jgi:hypothetical protein
VCYSLWYNAPTMLPTGHRPATSWVHYTTSSNTRSNAPEDGQNNCPKHVDLTGIINEPLLLHLVGCLYYLYLIIFWGVLAKQSQFIPLQNVVYFISLHFLVRKIFTFYIMMCYYLNDHFQGQRVNRENKL